MTTLYLHVGMLKTGTTAIQKFLAHNGEALGKQGAVYPDFGLRYPWVDADRNAHFLTKQGYEAKEAGACFERIHKLADAYETILLSDEGLWNGGGGNAVFWQELKARLRSDIRIRMVVYLRRQDSYIYSYWAQQVKAQQEISFKTMSFPEYLLSGTYRANRLNYRRYLQAGIRVLGKENVLVRVYEKGAFSGGSIYADYLQTVGLKLTDDFMIPQRPENISIRGNVLEAKRYLNSLPAFTQPGYRLLPYLEKAQKRMEEDGMFRERNVFPRENRRAFLKEYRASNRWVARELLGREDEVLFHEPIGQDTEPQSAYPTQEVTDACGYIILELMDEVNRLKSEQEKNKARRKTFGIRKVPAAFLHRISGRNQSV